MGNTRKTTDDALYEKRRAYYQKTRDRQLARAKVRYAENRGVVLATAAKLRAAAREARLRAKRLTMLRATRRPYVERAQLYVDVFKSAPCHDCGIVYPPVVMDFDHVRGTKLADISALVSVAASNARLDLEIAKCELVCANCHRLRTFARRGTPNTSL